MRPNFLLEQIADALLGGVFCLGFGVIAAHIGGLPLLEIYAWIVLAAWAGLAWCVRVMRKDMANDSGDGDGATDDPRHHP